MASISSTKTMNEAYWDALRVGDAYFLNIGKTRIGGVKTLRITMENPIGSGVDVWLKDLMGLAHGISSGIWGTVIYQPSVNLPVTPYPVTNMNFSFLAKPSKLLLKADIGDVAMSGTGTGTVFGFPGQVLNSYADYSVRKFPPGTMIGMNVPFEGQESIDVNFYGIIFEAT